MTFPPKSFRRTPLKPCMTSFASTPKGPLASAEKLANNIELTLPVDILSDSQLQSNILKPPYLLETADNQFPGSTTITNQFHLSQIQAHLTRTHFLENQNSTIQWNQILRSYIRLNSPLKALRAYLQLLRAGFSPDHYTVPIIVKASSQICPIRAGRQFHADALRRGVVLNDFVETGLITMYARTGEFQDAQNLFDENGNRKLGSWNAIIGAFSRSGNSKGAVDMFLRMKREGFMPDEVTLLSVLPGCGSLGDIKLALQLHKCVLQANARVKEDLLMMNSVVDMYGKCGRLDMASSVFSKMTIRNVSSWTSMIMGFAMHGHVEQAIGCFRCMVEEAKLMPNHVTFLGVLSACVHGGLVSQGKHYFDTMMKTYGIQPQMKHYGCMVDLLGRAGSLEEAKALIESMPMEASVVIWGCLMGACEKHGNVKIGEWVAKHLLEMEPWNDGVYVVLSNIYANMNMWVEVGRIRELMKKRDFAKFPGYSSVPKASN